MKLGAWKYVETGSRASHYGRASVPRHDADERRRFLGIGCRGQAFIEDGKRGGIEC